MGQWIVGVISLQKMYGLYGLKHHIVEINGDVTDAGRTNERRRRRTREDRATQPLDAGRLSLATNVYLSEGNHECTNKDNNPSPASLWVILPEKNAAPHLR